MGIVNTQPPSSRRFGSWSQETPFAGASPELNPIERVWKLTRRRCLHNRYFDNLQDVIGAVESEFAT